MGAKSNIPYVHHTFNPWWGCCWASPECDHCYARDLAHRLRPAEDFWAPKGPRRFFDANKSDHWQQPFQWNRRAQALGEIHRVLCGSMCDVFERPVQPGNAILCDATTLRMSECWVDLTMLIEQTPHLFWLLLTKRPENIPALWPEHWRSEAPTNIGLGVSVGMVESLWRIDALFRVNRLVPAALRFVSYEPALEGIHWSTVSRFPELGWLIVGCESGNRRRSAELRWFTRARNACQAFGVPFYLKQMDNGTGIDLNPELGGRTYCEIPSVAGGNDAV